MNDSVSFLASSANKMENLFQWLKPIKKQLNEIATLIPDQICDSNLKIDIDSVNLVYSDFRKSLFQIVSAYSELSELYHQFYQIFNNVTVRLVNIYKLMQEKINLNEVLTEQFFENQVKKIFCAESQIGEWQERIYCFQTSLKRTDFQMKTKLLLSTLSLFEKFSYMKEEFEKFYAQLSKRDNLINNEETKLELIYIKQNITNQQEERLENDYQATLSQRQKLIALSMSQYQQYLKIINQQNSETKGSNTLTEILDLQIAKYDSKLEDQEKDIQKIKLGKLEYLEKIQDQKNILRQLNMEKDNFCQLEGRLIKKDRIEEFVKEYEQKISQLGFSSKNHYDQLKEHLRNTDQIERVLINFLNQMTASMSHLNQIREFVSDGINQIKYNLEINESDIEYQLWELFQKSIQQNDQNQKLEGLSLSESIKFLIMITTKDEYTRILEDKELNYPLENLYSALKISDLFKLQDAQKKRGKIDNADEYLEKIFNLIFHFEVRQIKNPKIQTIQVKIEQLEYKIEVEEAKSEPNESKLEEFEEKLSQLQELEDEEKQTNQQKYQQFIFDHKREYDFTRNVIRNASQYIKLLEFKQRQRSKFMPLQMQGLALETLQQYCKKINQLSIE